MHAHIRSKGHHDTVEKGRVWVAVCVCTREHVRARVRAKGPYTTHEPLTTTCSPCKPARSSMALHMACMECVSGSRYLPICRRVRHAYTRMCNANTHRLCMHAYVLHPGHMREHMCIARPSIRCMHGDGDLMAHMRQVHPRLADKPARRAMFRIRSATTHMQTHAQTHMQTHVQMHARIRIAHMRVRARCTLLTSQRAVAMFPLIATQWDVSQP